LTESRGVFREIHHPAFDSRDGHTGPRGYLAGGQALLVEFPNRVLLGSALWHGLDCIGLARSFLFRLALHVAMQLGPYHHPTWGGQRMASEGSRFGAFPADCPHRAHCHRPHGGSVGYSGVPAYS
jgi:hypothetical protein